MDIKVNVKRKYKVNGVEYDSLGAMPPEVRQAVERATAEGGLHVSAGAEAHLVFNGKRYGSREEMPEEERELYDAGMAALPEAGTSGGQGAAPPSSIPIGPASVKNLPLRLLLLAGLILLLWLGWHFLKDLR